MKIASKERDDIIAILTEKFEIMQQEIDSLIDKEDYMQESMKSTDIKELDRSIRRATETKKYLDSTEENLDIQVASKTSDLKHKLSSLIKEMEEKRLSKNKE